MSLVPSTLQSLLTQYRDVFKSVNIDTLPLRVYPGDQQLLTEYNRIATAEEADQFFAKYGVGNPRNVIHKPFERQAAYELLLKILKEYDPLQYYKIHKGTPYYFIAWPALLSS